MNRCANTMCRDGLVYGQGDVHPCVVCTIPCTECPRAEPWVESAYELAWEEWRLRAWAWLCERGLVTGRRAPDTLNALRTADGFTFEVVRDMALNTRIPQAPKRPMCPVCFDRKRVPKSVLKE